MSAWKAKLSKPLFFQIKNPTEGQIFYLQGKSRQVENLFGYG
jgi:hypothetical protein